jgi:hypothetical protein
MFKRSIAAALALAALTGCGTAVGQPSAAQLMLQGNRFETLRSKKNVDPILRKAVQDAAKKGLNILNNIEVDPSRLNPALAAALAKGQITEKQIVDLITMGSAQEILQSIATLLQGREDDYAAQVADRLTDLMKRITKFEKDRQNVKSDAEMLKLVASLRKDILKALDTLATEK